ncbi:uncharacterized protein [Nicotiana tomentosiformis]|uniref:uncharacterized protein n=1 Tax=Nicotiana tomentosiformis TaxID=4098 RepID=UPI00388C5091
MRCFCATAIETSAHIFFDCPNAKSHQLTSQSTTATQSQPPTFTSRSWSNSCLTLRRKPFNNVLSWEGLFPFSFWQLWITMNNNLFKNKKVPISVVLAKATEYITISVNQTPIKEKTIWVKWVPPLTCHYKLNTDEAALGNHGKGGTGGVFNGNLVLEFMGSMPHTTNTQAELLAVLQGLQIEKQRGFTPLKSTQTQQRSIILILRDVVVKHNYMKTNKVANLMAKEAANKDFFGRTTTMIVPPVFANEVFWADILGTVFPRKILDCNINTLDHRSGVNSYPLKTMHLFSNS